MPVTTPDTHYGLSGHPILAHEAKDDAIRKLWERMDGIDARQGLIDALWARIPAEITEWGYTTSATELNVQPVTTELVRVRSIVAFVETTDGAVIRLGTVTFPIPSRFTNWRGLNIALNVGDTRRLTAASAGALGLILSSEVQPRYGHL